MADQSNPGRAWRLSPDMIAALSAVLIGVCALGVSLYQAAIMREQSQLMRQQQEASVWPNIAIENSFNGDDFELRIVNTGIGPAKIGPVRVTFGGQPIQNWTEWIRNVHPGQRISYYHSKVGDRVIPAGDFEKVFGVSEQAIAESLQRHIERLGIEVCYCSVYDECWQYVQRFDGSAMRDGIEQCQATEADFLQ